VHDIGMGLASYRVKIRANLRALASQQSRTSEDAATPSSVPMLSIRRLLERCPSVAGVRAFRALMESCRRSSKSSGVRSASCGGSWLRSG